MITTAAIPAIGVNPDGRLKYGLRHPWRDGTTAVLMEPLEFMERLAALVPAPRRHQLRYHGTLAPHAKWRPLIVPTTQPPTGEARCGVQAAEGRPRGGASRRDSRGRSC